MHAIIKGGQILSREQGREIDAALALSGKDRKTWAAEQRLSYQRVNRMVRGEEVVTPEYAARLNRLRGSLRRHVTTSVAA